MRITQKVNAAVMAKLSAHYFYLKTNISVDFQICISVPLINLLKTFDTNCKVKI